MEKKLAGEIEKSSFEGRRSDSKSWVFFHVDFLTLGLLLWACSDDKKVEERSESKESYHPTALVDDTCRKIADKCADERKSPLVGSRCKFEDCNLQFRL